MKTALKMAGALLGILAAMALIPALLLTCFVATMREDTVIDRVESPDGSRWAVVISSDHGATGGATYVDVEEHPVQILFITLPGKSQRVYTGRWGEAQTIWVTWEDADTLLIDGTAYSIPE